MKDNLNLVDDGDTGNKITAFLIMNENKYVDKEYG